LLPALAGANMIYGAGMVETGQTMDYGQLVIDNEFASLVKYVLGGIPVNDETLALDVIHEVGASKNFLSHEHTLKYMRTAQTYSDLIDRQTLENWEAEGQKDIHRKAWEKAKQILKNHQPEPLPKEVQTTLGSIVAETEDELGILQKG